MNKYKISFYILLLLFIATIVGFVWYIFKPVVILTSDKPDLTALSTPSPSEAPVPVITPVPVVNPTPAAEVSDLIKKAMAELHSKDISEVNLSIAKIDGDYASGGVIFDGEIGGAWWLASKLGGEWEIVADGNGTVMCSSLAGYSFPVSMVPECWNETTNTLVKF